MSYIGNNPRAKSLRLETTGGSSATPATGLISLYSKTDNKLYFKDSTGAETSILNGTSRADVATAATIASLSSAATFIRLTGATATQLQGIAAGASGQILTIYNVSSGLITISNQNASATAANRIITHTGKDSYISSGRSAIFEYDDVQGRWILVQSAEIDGTYTPIFSNIAGITSPVASVSNYFQVGNTAFVTGIFNYSDVSAANITIDFTLPIATANFTTTLQSTGIATLTDPNGIINMASGFVSAVVGSQLVGLRVTPSATTTGSGTGAYTFSYRIQ